MTEPSKPESELDEISGDNIPDDDSADPMRALLKKTLPIGPPPDLVKGVQRKIRARSKGKFFSDGWSTSGGNRLNYILLAITMLLISVLAYAVLGPTGFH